VTWDDTSAQVREAKKVDSFLQKQARAATHAGKTYKYRNLEKDTDAAERKALLIGAQGQGPGGVQHGGAEGSASHRAGAARSGGRGEGEGAKEGGEAAVRRGKDGKLAEEEERRSDRLGERRAIPMPTERAKDADLDRKASQLDATSKGEGGWEGGSIR